MLRNKCCRHIKEMLDVMVRQHLTVPAESNYYTSSVDICCSTCGYTFTLEPYWLNGRISEVEAEAWLERDDA